MSLHFIDVGSNQGQTFPDYLRQHSRFDGAHVWCLEPSPRHLPCLMETMRQHSPLYQLHLCPFGLRGTSGLMDFFYKDDPRGDSFEHYLASDHETKNVSEGYGLTLPAVDAADFILHITKPGDEVVLKIDAEGSEYDILTGLLGRPDALGRVSEILVEWHTIQPTGKRVYSAAALTEAYRVIGIELKQWMF